MQFEARQLDYAYPGGPLVVHNVSLSAGAGSMTAVIGANGSGKSTLIRMLAGLLAPQSGSIALNNIPLHQWPPRQRARHIAYVPQSTTTAFPFPAIDIVMSGRTPYATPFRFESAHDSQKAMDALETTGAAHLAHRAFTSLSGGERQMVILARALAQEPQLLLLDEPSSALDLKHRAGLIRTLARLRDTTQLSSDTARPCHPIPEAGRCAGGAMPPCKGLSVIMITHDLQLTGSFDQILALRCGEVAACGAPSEVLRDAVLRDVYSDPNVRAQVVGNQTLVWVDL